MIVLADNDLILKLAQCGLLEALPILLGEDADASAFVLPTAKYKLLPINEQKALSRAGNEATLQSLRSFFRDAQVLPPVQNSDLLDAMENVPGIDGGEQLLFAAMVELDRPTLATGDKRALTSVLSNHERIPGVCDALNDRVLTFESAILLAIREFGFPNVKQRLLGCPKPDGMLRLVLKDGMEEQDLIDCLVSHCRSQFQFLACKDRLADYFDNDFEDEGN